VSSRVLRGLSLADCLISHAVYRYVSTASYYPATNIYAEVLRFRI